MQGAAVHEAEVPGVSREAARSLYRHMVRLRIVSARMVELQRAEKIAFHASCLGEEAAIAAAALAARDQDWLFPGVREWGAAIVRGVPIATYVHHAFGSASDPAKGHAAPDHAPARRFRVGPASGVVGAHVPQAVGAAWAAKIRKEDVVTVALFGEGATSTGDFHNAMNFAGVFKAPCVMICRNNGRAGATPAARQTRSESFAAKAVGYGLASARLDGDDPLAVLAEIRGAVARAAQGKGAALIEVVTRPFASESGALPEGLFVNASLGAGNPCSALRARLEREGWLEAGETEALVAEARAEVDAAAAAAERAGSPARATLFEDVYAEVPSHLVAQKETASWQR